MKERLNWAVLGTGVIANQMAQALQKMGKPLYAVGNRTYEKAVAFAENTVYRRFIQKLMKCLLTKMWILSTLQVLTIPIMPL